MTERELKDARDMLCKLARSRTNVEAEYLAYIEGCLDMYNEVIRILVCDTQTHNAV